MGLSFWVGYYSTCLWGPGRASRAAEGQDFVNRRMEAM